MDNLYRYLSRYQFDMSSDDFIFCGFTYFKSKNCYQPRKANKPLSYSTVRTTLLSVIKSIGLDLAEFGTHSLRAGGATTAANNGVEDRLFKRHGRWSSESAKDGYIKDTTAKRFKVSASLGI